MATSAVATETRVNSAYCDADGEFVRIPMNMWTEAKALWFSLFEEALERTIEMWFFCGSDLSFLM